MKAHTAVFLIAACIVVPSAIPGQVANIDVRSADSIARVQVDSGFSGVVLIARGHTVLLRKAYAPRGERVTTDAPFWIASITKSFTAAAILQLQKEGRVTLEDSIGRFFSGVPVDKRAITLRQLLTHTSGLGGEYTGGGITERSAAVRAILAHELISKPGTQYK